MWRRDATLTKLLAAPNSSSMISFFFFSFFCFFSISLPLQIFSVLFSFLIPETFISFSIWVDFAPWLKLDTGRYGLWWAEEVWWWKEAIAGWWRLARDGPVLLHPLRVCLLYFYKCYFLRHLKNSICCSVIFKILLFHLQKNKFNQEILHFLTVKLVIFGVVCFVIFTGSFEFYYSFARHSLWLYQRSICHGLLWCFSVPPSVRMGSRFSLFARLLTFVCVLIRLLLNAADILQMYLWEMSISRQNVTGNGTQLLAPKFLVVFSLCSEWRRV